MSRRDKHEMAGSWKRITKSTFKNSDKIVIKKIKNDKPILIKYLIL